jgi:NTP pyrophosphatase (non-canonical NTP hydrolase)
MNLSSQNPSLVELTELVRSFAEARDWQQFHTARNLVLALVGEAGELASEFQWINDSEVGAVLSNPDKRDAIGSELADVFTYLLRLADVTGIDLANELTKKIAINEIRYPVEKSKGSAAKYTAYE